MTTSYVHNTPRLQLSDLQLKKLYSFFPQEMFSTNKHKGVVESVRIKRGKRITTRRPEKKQEENTTRRPENKQEEISPYPASLNNIHSSSVTTSGRSNKRALLCGVTYNTRKYRLKGTVNDVINMRELLINQFHYPPEFIKVMTEYEKGELIPTKHNIKNSLKWLVEGCKAGDSLVFYFSGHGLRQPDFKDDERDGFDETICPVDFLQEGMILDSDINTDIVKPLKKGVTLHAIVDACQSGTILDLVHVYDHHKSKWEDNRPPSGVDNGTGGGLAICINACNDDKMASETSAFGAGTKTLNGAMTFILCRALKQNPDITYRALLNKMSDTIRQVNEDRCLQSGICRKISRHKVRQEPMLSSSEKFDVNTMKFIL